MDFDVHRNNIQNDTEDQDCAVCLQKYHYPTQLPCGHVFCFLCVKGIAIQSKKCAMCRKKIPSDYLDHPVLLQHLPSDQISTGCSNEEYQWYYEGRNGWWKYDERSNTELELALSSGETECILLLAGTLYCVDFQNMLQVRRSDPTRRRRVRRDTPTLPSKGIAGIKKIEQIQEETVNEENQNVTVTTLQEESENTSLIEDTEDSGNHNENVSSVSVDVDNVIESLSDMILGNPDEHHNSPDEENT